MRGPTRDDQAFFTHFGYGPARSGRGRLRGVTMETSSATKDRAPAPGVIAEVARALLAEIERGALEATPREISFLRSVAKEAGPAARSV